MGYIGYLGLHIFVFVDDFLIVGESEAATREGMRIFEALATADCGCILTLYLFVGPLICRRCAPRSTNSTPAMDEDVTLRLIKD